MTMTITTPDKLFILYYTSVSLSTFYILQSLNYEDIYDTYSMSCRFIEYNRQRYYNTRVYYNFIASLGMPILLPPCVPFISLYTIMKFFS
jgi:hypothetical protein